MIALRFPTPATEETPASVISSEPRTVEIIQQPLFLQGRDLAFARVRALHSGTAQLRCGNAALRTTVVNRGSKSTGEFRQPAFLAPSEGAFVSGNFSIAAEIFADPLQPAAGQGTVELVLPSGKSVIASEEMPAVDGPFRRFRFQVDADSLTSGPVIFRARAVNPDKARIESEPLTLWAGRAGATIADECENHLTAERPQTFGDVPPLVAFDAGASGSQFVSMAAKRPVWRVRAQIAAEGDYQLFLRGRATPSAGSLPALRVLNIEDDRTLAGGALAGTAWHRVPVGRPFHLKAGETVLGVELANELSVANRAVRAAALDRFELVAVPDGAAFRKPQVAFAEAVDGAHITGPFRIRAVVLPEPSKEATPLDVVLTANGTAVARTRQDAPGFALDPTSLRRGSNRLRLQMLGPDARVLAQSVEQTVTIDTEPPPTMAARTESLAAPGPAWTAKGGAPQKDLESGKESWVFAANSTGAFALPPEWHGRSTLELELRGEAFQGPPVAELELLAGDLRMHLGSISAEPGWRTAGVEPVDLPPGPKSVQVRFANDRFEAGKGDRNLHVAALRIRSQPVRAEIRPQIRILHPAPGTTLGPADVAILEIQSPLGIRGIEVRMDDQPISWAVAPPNGIGPVVAPLPLRALGSGPHQLSATVTDHRGGATTSSPTRVILDPATTQSRYLQTVRLLDQMGYGPEPRQLARLLTGPVDSRFPVALEPTPGDAAAMETAALRQPGTDDNAVIARAIEQALLTPDPVRMRFVLWVENHFSTWIRKAGSAAKWGEHTAFWRLGPASFLDLLRASATSPAMLVYLDQQRSFAGKLNENYARELLELHTLGVEGGYAQNDVTTLAGLLTGWTAQDEFPLEGNGTQTVGHFRYAPYLNDGAAHEVLGLRLPESDPAGRYDRVCEVLELLAAHPSTTRFVLNKLAAHYAGTTISRELADDLSPVFQRTGGDMRAVLEALARSPRAASAPPRIASPADYAIRLCRVAGIHAPNEARELMLRTGRAPFDRSTPDGYPEGDMLQADSNLLLQKWGLAARLGERMLARIPRPLFQAPALEAPAGRQRLLDWMAIRLTGRSLGPNSNEAGLRLLEAPFPMPEDAAVQAAVFVAQCPEAQLR